MKYLLTSLRKFTKILNNRRLSIFLDYDGTIVPITSTPQKAILPQNTKELLRELSKKVNLSIISGRSLKNIKKMVGIRNIIYVGNHGLEIQGPGLRLKHKNLSKFNKIIEHIKIELRKKLFSIKGVLLEDKGPTLSIHYRLVDKKYVAIIKDVFKKVTAPRVLNKKIRIASGKKVLEIRPNLKWNKGDAALYILKNKKGLPIYIGDDITDEDAFKVLKNNGITIFVGKPRKSHAKFYLKNTKEVKRFLGKILNE